MNMTQEELKRLDKQINENKDAVFPVTYDMEKKEITITGLKKRELFALVSMHALLNNVNAHNFDGMGYKLYDKIAEVSVMMAEATLKELKK